MEIIRKLSKPAAIFLAFYMLMLSGPCQSAWAGMIATESTINRARNQTTREYLNNLLVREDIRAALVSQGIDPKEAMARIDSLSDAEANDVVTKLDQLPAGGFAETILIVALLVFLILLFTDIAGYTDVFPFVEKNVSKKETVKETSTEINPEKRIKSVSEDAGIKPNENLTIYFNSNSNELSEKAIGKLDRVAEIFIKNPKAEITLNGYSDSTGTASFNKMVSESRANSVKTYLIGKGVNPSKMKIVSHGAQKFLSNNKTEEGRRLNRRVEIYYNYE